MKRQFDDETREQLVEEGRRYDYRLEYEGTLVDALLEALDIERESTRGALRRQLKGSQEALKIALHELAEEREKKVAFKGLILKLIHALKPELDGLQLIEEAEAAITADIDAAREGSKE